MQANSGAPNTPLVHHYTRTMTNMHGGVSCEFGIFMGFLGNSEQ
jgi:hypothetical protein